MSSPTYSEHTIKRYKQVVRLIPPLYESTFHTPFTFPETLNEDFDNIVQMLTNKYMASTLPNCIAGIIWSLDTFDHKEDYDYRFIQSIQEKYQLINSKLIADSFKRSLSTDKVLSEREQKTYQNWDAITQMYHIMAKKLDKLNFTSFLEFVIISLYVLHPPVRADYAGMKVFIDDSYVPVDSQENYCVLQTNPRFVFNQYKTSKRYGQTVIPMNDELHDILLDWMSINPTDDLLVSYIHSKQEYKSFTETTLSHRIPLIFKKYTEIPSTINTMRHSYISHVTASDTTLANMLTKKGNSEKMMHSMVMAEGYQRTIV